MSGTSLDILLERLRNDRFSEDERPSENESGRSFIRGWNAGSLNAERIVKRWANEQRVIDALAELERNAP